MFIYTLSDPRTEEVRYVGKTERSFEVRKNEHRHVSKRGRTHLYCWWRSLPLEPVMEIVEECFSKEGLPEAECFWISQFRSLGFNLVNHTDGGEGQTGLKHSAASRAKMSASQKGIKKPGTAAAARGHKHNLGRVRTEEDKIAKSRALGGKPIQDQNGKIYSTTRGACRELNLNQSHVLAVLKGRAKSHKGFIFKYVEPAHNLLVQE